MLIQSCDHCWPNWMYCSCFQDNCENNHLPKCLKQSKMKCKSCWLIVNKSSWDSFEICYNNLRYFWAYKPEVIGMLFYVTWWFWHIMKFGFSIHYLLRHNLTIYVSNSRRTYIVLHKDPLHLNPFNWKTLKSTNYTV